MEVIHGQGTPRLIVELDTPLLDWTYVYNPVQPVGYTVKLNASAVLSQNMIGYMLEVRVDKYGEIVFCANGKITDIDATNKIVTVDRWYVPYIGNQTPGAFYVVGSLGQVRIKDLVVDLPYCETLIEKFKEDSVKHSLYNGKKTKRVKGFWYSATLDYSSYMSKATVEALHPIFQINRRNMTLYPRNDNPNIFYKVDLADDFEFTMAQIKKHLGHKSISVELEGLERLKTLNLLTEDPAGYGDSYGGTLIAGYGDVL